MIRWHASFSRSISQSFISFSSCSCFIYTIFASSSLILISQSTLIFFSYLLFFQIFSFILCISSNFFLKPQYYNFMDSIRSSLFLKFSISLLFLIIYFLRHFIVCKSLALSFKNCYPSGLDKNRFIKLFFSSIDSERVLFASSSFVTVSLICSIYCQYCPPAYISFLCISTFDEISSLILSFALAVNHSFCYYNLYFSYMTLAVSQLAHLHFYKASFRQLSIYFSADSRFSIFWDNFEISALKRYSLFSCISSSCSRFTIVYSYLPLIDCSQSTYQFNTDTFYSKVFITSSLCSPQYIAFSSFCQFRTEEMLNLAEDLIDFSYFWLILSSQA